MELADGDLFLLCSDGLTDMVSPKELKAVLSGRSTSREKAEKLVELALAGGGRDNGTGIGVPIQGNKPGWQRLLGRAGGEGEENG